MTLINKERLQTELEQAEKNAITANIKYGISVARHIVEQAPVADSPKGGLADIDEIMEILMGEIDG